VALGLVLLEFGLFMIPDSINLPGGIVAWLVLLVVFWRVIPLALIVTLAAAAIIHFSDTKASRGMSE
jgi:hypothetical protein